jgi:hypothetical protein
VNAGTRALRAVTLWDTWARIFARGGDDLAARLTEAAIRVSAKKPPTRLRLGLRHSSTGGQLVLELRIDFAGAARAELELDGVVHRENAVIRGDDTSHWSAVEFGGKYLELRVIHEGVPKLMNAVYARSTFLPQLPALDDVARIVALEIGVDVTSGAAQRIHFEVRQGKDERAAFARMNFRLTDADGAPFTAADEAMHQDRRGPNAGWPRGVAWRRDDAVIVHDSASFGAAADRIFRR